MKTSRLLAVPMLLAFAATAADAAGTNVKANAAATSHVAARAAAYPTQLATSTIAPSDVQAAIQWSEDGGGAESTSARRTSQRAAASHRVAG
jgi:hypothetical protein